MGGVHVHIFLKDPHFPLRNPKVSTHHQHVHVRFMHIVHCTARVWTCLLRFLWTPYLAAAAAAVRNLHAGQTRSSHTHNLMPHTCTNLLKPNISRSCFVQLELAGLHMPCTGFLRGPVGGILYRSGRQTEQRQGTAAVSCHSGITAGTCSAGRSRCGLGLCSSPVEAFGGSAACQTPRSACFNKTCQALQQTLPRVCAHDMIYCWTCAC